MNEMKKLESDIVKVLGIAPTGFFNMDESDEVVKKAYEKINDFLKRAFKEPTKVIQDF
jgi:hypothetical protein